MRIIVRVRPDDPAIDTKRTARRISPVRAKSNLVCDPRVGDRIAIGGDGTESFVYDVVLGQDSTQFDAYAHCGEPLLDALLEGYNASLFAYGQSGAGKTFSMLGAGGGRWRNRQDGIIPLVVDELFRRTTAIEDATGHAFCVMAQYVEVYSGRVYDLLSEACSGSREPEFSLPLMESHKGAGGDEPKGATTIKVHTTKGLLELIAEASSRRATASNAMHEHSSRSHALLKLVIERRIPNEKGYSAQTTHLHMVDLAGSEGFSAGAGVGINEGLLALGKVITALAEKASHVPYRDSPLTRPLRGALGGDSQTVMLNCISPGEPYASESLNTLKYASAARRMSQTVKVQKWDRVVPHDPMEGNPMEHRNPLSRHTPNTHTHTRTTWTLTPSVDRGLLRPGPNDGPPRRDHPNGFRTCRVWAVCRGPLGPSTALCSRLRSAEQFSVLERHGAGRSAEVARDGT